MEYHLTEGASLFKCYNIPLIEIVIFLPCQDYEDIHFLILFRTVA